MSLRHQRRLRQQVPLSVTEPDSSAQSSDDDDALPVRLTKPSNFGLLLASDSESDDAQLESKNVDGLEQREQPQLYAKTSKVASKKTSKRKADTVTADEDGFFTEQTEGPYQSQTGTPTVLDRYLTLASSTCANADAELIRIFGRVPAAVQAPDGAGMLNPRVPRQVGGGRPGGGSGAPSHGGSGLALVTPDTVTSNGQGWPFVAAPTAVAGGFSMQSVEPGPSSDCGRWFTMVQSDEYRAMLQEWEAIGATGDPQLTHDFAVRNLYCVSAMLGLAEYYRTVRQPDAAVVHIRRALYTLERCLHPSFKPWEAKQPCRMAYGASERNREFYSILFKAQARAATAGAYDASFHLCKLLLQLSPPTLPHSAVSWSMSGGQRSSGSGLLGWGSAHTDAGTDDAGDPLRAALVADTAALRCGQDEWIIGMTGASKTKARQQYTCTLRGTSVPLMMLPGWALARARALFRLQQAVMDGKVALDNSTSAPLHSTSSGSLQGEEQATGRWMHEDCSFLSGPTSMSAILLDWAADLRRSGKVPSPTRSATAQTIDPASRTLVRTLLTFPHVLLPLLTALGFKREDQGLASVLGDVSVPKASAPQRAARASGRAGDLAMDAAALLAQHCLVPSQASCPWAPVFDHPLFAAPYKEYLKIRAGELECGSVPSEGLFGGATGCTWFTHEGLETIVTITARRHAQVWRSPAALLWLHACALAALQAYDSARMVEGEADAAGGAKDGDQGQKEADERTVLAAAEAFTARAWFQEVYGRTGLPDASTEGGSRRDNDKLAITACITHYGSAGPLHDYTDEKEPTMDADMAAGGGDIPAAVAQAGGQGGGVVGGAGRRPFRGYCGCSALWNRIAAAAGYNPLVVLFASLFPGYRTEGQ